MKEMNTEMIDKAYEYARNMFKSEEEFLAYWENNYVKFCEDFAEGKFLKGKKNRKKPAKRTNKVTFEE